jgi:hypothetical protein
VTQNLTYNPLIVFSSVWSESSITTLSVEPKLVTIAPIGAYANSSEWEAYAEQRVKMVYAYSAVKGEYEAYDQGLLK